LLRWVKIIWRRRESHPVIVVPLVGGIHGIMTTRVWRILLLLMLLLMEERIEVPIFSSSISGHGWIRRRIGIYWLQVRHHHNNLWMQKILHVSS
jgi:hypothetical protein